MRSILLAVTGLALSACGGGGEREGGDANAMATDNMAMDQNMMMDANMMDANMTMDANMSGNAMGNMGGNAADANTQQMMKKDATTNDPDTNLANGM